jgi:filamentous hemagglutinin family protein
MHPVTRVWHILVLPVKLLLALVTYQPLALALPQGGVVTQGAALIQQESPTKLNIHQSSDRAIINWHSFSIGAPEWVNFQQPSSTSATLNRVTGNTPSSIAGKLTANGQIFLINPNGIAFLPTAQVDVAGLVASTLNIKDSDFMRGVWRFEQMPGKPPASVTNEGLITVKEAGFAALVAPAVQNSGVISARLGKVVLASGTTVSLDFYGDGLLSVTVDPQLAGQITDIYGNKLSSLINNQGIITAPGGMVTLSAQAAGQIVDRVINTGGIIEAKYAENRNGVIVLSGGSKGIVAVNGVLDVSGEKGGKVQITGENVGLFGSAKVDASGDKAGGLVLLGGDYLGGRADKQRIDPSLNAQNTYVSSGSVIHADAKVTGDGGEVIVWADNFTRFDGTITARGDNGGFVETSGKNILQVGDSARVDTTGRTGKTGTWLLDPLDLTISAAGDNKVSAPFVFQPTDTGSNLSNTTLNTALGTTNVTVKTSGTVGSENGDIIFASNANVNWATANTLTVQAARRIVMQPGSKITSTNPGTFDAVIFQSNIDDIKGNFSGIELNSSTISTQGGNIQLIGTGGNMGSNNYGIYQHSGTQVTSATGNITYEGTGGDGANFNHGVYLTGLNTAITSNSGAIEIKGKGQGSSLINYGIWQNDQAQVNTISGNITYKGTGGNGTISNEGVRLEGTNTKITSNTGAIEVTGIGGGSLGNGNFGIHQLNGAEVQTTSGNITYDGKGADAGSTNHGVVLAGANTKITSDTGAISITGQGQGNGNLNIGIYQFNGAQVSTTTNISGKGNITYTGTGGDGAGGFNYGVNLLGSSTKISTDAGEIKITGKGQGTGSGNIGIYQVIDTEVSSKAGDIIYIGKGANSAPAIATAVGTNLIGNGTTGEIRLISNGGNINLDNVTIQSNGEDVIIVSNNTVRQNSASKILANGLALKGSGIGANYILNAPNNDVNFFAANVIGGVTYQDVNALTLDTVTSTALALTVTGFTTGNGDGIIRTGNTLTLNKATNLGTGNLTLKSGGGVTQNANGQIIANGLGLQGSSNFILNNSNNNIDVFAAQVTGDVSLVNSDTVTVNKVTSTVTTLDTLTTTAVTATGTIFIQTKTGNIVLNKSVSSDLGNITLVAEDNFINNVGAGALSAPNGKWLVYATSPAGNVNGWPVLGGSEQFNTTYPQPPLFTGNGFLYKVGLPIPDVNLTQPITFSFNEQGWFDFGSREITVFQETLLCVTVPVNQEEEETQTFSLFQLATEALFPSRFETYETYWWPGKFPECKGQIDGLSSR